MFIDNYEECAANIMSDQDDHLAHPPVEPPPERRGADFAGYLSGQSSDSHTLDEAALGFWARRTFQLCRFWAHLTCLGEMEQWTLGKVPEPPVFEPEDALPYEAESEGSSVLEGILNLLRIGGSSTTEMVPIFCLCTPEMLRTMTRNYGVRDWT